MRAANLIESFNCAIEGFIYVLKTQRNMRIHFLSAIFVLVLGIYLSMNTAELVTLCLVITLVLCAELINTATEYALDLVSDKFNPLARIIKDISAAAVLLTGINAAVVGYLIFSKNFRFPLETGIVKIKQSPWHITFISVILVLALVVAGKALLHKGRPLMGGMPSGHSAIAFSLWTIILFAAKSDLIVALVFIMAFIIAWSRVQKAIHSVWEVACGGLLGVLVTTTIIQLLQQ